MNQPVNHTRPHLLGLLAGLFLAVGLVFSAMVVTRAWLKIAESQSISVTGSAKRSVVSDLVLWSGSYSVQAPTLLDAQLALKEARAKVAMFMTAHAITNVTYSSIQIEEQKASTKGEDGFQSYRTCGYRLAQSVDVKSADISAVLAMDSETPTLVERGVLFTSAQPQYIYTKAGEAKVEMLAEATRDARARAEQIATQGDARVAGLRSARMGVFQIASEYSNNTSWEGVSDTSSLNKTITAVVNATFSLK
jgi:uncharacterized protein